jgi:2-polyprenyl-3-methyl-5-hydroxy-6-metoxy-1,4-benzoquinol methylase
MDKDKVKKYLQVIKRAVLLIQEQFDSDSVVDEDMMQEILGEVNKENIVDKPESKKTFKVDSTVKVTKKENDSDKENRLRQKHVQSLMEIDCWPEAVPNFLVGGEVSDTDQINRANAVLDMMLDRSVENLNFLDFGCGEGWIANEVMKRGVATSTGYDLWTKPNWVKFDKPTFTNLFSDLKSEYYDLIMLYDVIDHCDNPLDVVDKIKSLLSPNGIVYVRCHPWISKHGSHVYKQGLNKSYVHLFLTYEELTENIDEPPLFVRRELNPLEAYRYWFNDFEISKERIIREELSEFFLVPSFKKLVIAEQELPEERHEEFFKDMEIQFVDYVLEKND